MPFAELLDSAVTRPAYMSIRSLLEQAQFLGENGLDNRVYKAELFSKIFFPLSVMALVLVGMPFVFGSARHHNLGVRVFIGISIGVLFTIFEAAIKNFGTAYGIHASLSTLAPAALIALAAIFVLRRSV